MSIYHYKSTKQVLSAVVFDGTINSVRMFIPVDLYEYEKHDRVNDTQFPPHLRIKSNNDILIASIGDYIVKFLNKPEFYVMKPQDFMKNYEAI